jgi:hypothetical protein
MGNRAVISNREAWRDVAIYVHWNGGRPSIEAFLKYAKDKKIGDDIDGLARLVQIICNYTGGTMSVGVGNIDRLDTDSDHGIYEISNWEIVGRRKNAYPEQTDPTGKYGKGVYNMVAEANDEFFDRGLSDIPVTVLPMPKTDWAKKKWDEIQDRNK